MGLRGPQRICVLLVPCGRGAASLCGYGWGRALGVGECVSVYVSRCVSVCVRVCVYVGGGRAAQCQCVSMSVSVGVSVSACERVCVMCVRGVCEVCRCFCKCVGLCVCVSGASVIVTWAGRSQRLHLELGTPPNFQPLPFPGEIDLISNLRPRPQRSAWDSSPSTLCSLWGKYQVLQGWEGKSGSPGSVDEALPAPMNGEGVSASLSCGPLLPTSPIWLRTLRECDPHSQVSKWRRREGRRREGRNPPKITRSSGLGREGMEREPRQPHSKYAPIYGSSPHLLSTPSPILTPTRGPGTSPAVPLLGQPGRASPLYTCFCCSFSLVMSRGLKKKKLTKRCANLFVVREPWPPLCTHETDGSLKAG